MRIFITGGTGFIGGTLVPRLRLAGHEVVLLVRRGEKARYDDPLVATVEGEGTEPGPWWEEVAKSDAAINLAGEPIAGRWTAEKKVALVESRVKTTANLVAALPVSKPFRLLSASAVGIYGDAGEVELDEAAPPGRDFLAQLAVRWEAEAQRGGEKGASVAVMRFGIVMGVGGGALAEMVKNTNKLIGGPVGSGDQYFSWIHIDDLAEAILWLLEKPEHKGAWNLCAPNPLRQRETAQILGGILSKPAFVKAPAFAVRLLLGEFADVVLFSQRMVPGKLLEAGFKWKYPTFAEAMKAILRG